MLKIAQLASKVSPEGAKWAHLGPLLPIFGHLGHSFAHFYTFLLGFREQLCIFAEHSWKANKNSAKCTENYKYCTETQKKVLKSA